MEVVFWLKYGTPYDPSEPVSGLKKMAFDLAGILSDEICVSIIGPGKKNTFINPKVSYTSIQAASEAEYIKKSVDVIPQADIIHCFSHRYYMFMDEGKPKTILHLHTSPPPLFWGIGDETKNTPEKVTFISDNLDNINYWVKTKNHGVDQIIACSQFVGDEAKNIFPSTPVKIIYNFIRSEDIGETYDPSGDLLLYVGAIVPEKGVDVLLKAARILHDKGCAVPIHFIGSSKSWGSQYDKKFKESASSYSNVSLQGPKNHSDVLGYMKKSAVGIVPTLKEEAFGMVAAEFMACGKPVIASDVGGLPEVVDDGETGFIIPPNNPKALAEKILILLNNQELAVKMGEMGRLRVEKLFSDKTVKKDYLDVYTKLVKTKLPDN